MELGTLQRSQWEAFAALIIGGALAIVAGMVLIPLATLVILAFVIAGAVLFAANTAYAALSRQPAAGSTATPASEPAALSTLQVHMPDGQLVVGRAVLSNQNDSYQMVLTGSGYVMVDDTGRVLHSL